ncbi:Core-2/I-Branching enzyme [Nocardioides exalbidus]|uniref:Peptide O-xylosyltransferase n=1 Tax=Nocardioides exalbidus TaxID=402596 RepID=A0A1H4LA14_9ACTN|nr:beta-1,6-N-acetylglucosaminyltransferase [Nocardioides exalbidus]SEB67574.1 Core-2/I-Branching enzyme [Nocardioides exalbidus]
MSRHAYLITAYNDLYVLENLLRLIDDERNEIFVHLDRRFVAADPARLRSLCRCRVTFVDRTKVHWGDYSQVAAVFRLFKAATPGRFNYYHLLSGSDLPIKSQDAIHEFFTIHEGREFVGYAATPFDRTWVTELHFFNRFMRPANRVQYIVRNRGTANIIRLQRRLGYDHSRKFGLELRKGSDWFSITHSLALHLLDNEGVVRRLLRFGHVPTEVYMQTLVWNSEFRERLYDETDEFRGSARLIDWDRGGPHVFTGADFDELMSSDRMFARKFVSSTDRQVVDNVVGHLT